MVLTVLEGVLTVLLEAAAAEAHMVGSGGGLGRVAAVAETLETSVHLRAPRIDSLCLLEPVG